MNRIKFEFADDDIVFVSVKCAHSSVLKENEELQQKVELLNTQIETIKLDHTVQMKNLDKTKDNTELKLRFTNLMLSERFLSNNLSNV